VITAESGPTPTEGGECRLEELLIDRIAGLLEGCRHVAVGVSSPIPGSAALLARHLSGGATRVSVLGSRHLQSFTDGGVEIFDLAAQGRIDAFFLSGGQIDGSGNINLVGVGEYPTQKVRWSGSFGSAYLYYLVPRVILFRLEHSRRTMVEKIDFISAPGTSDRNVFRPGGPHALITNLCLFTFDCDVQRFRLQSIHPGHTLEEVRDNTGFDFEVPSGFGPVPATPAPDASRLALIRGEISSAIADPYPKFAAEVLGHTAAA
tara:strand:- start:7125 stop:7910 length:786 start_codon:yes stop_codon:yes gene_type:complete